MNTLDVSKAIRAKSDQLNADDLIGGPMTIRIRDVDVRDTVEQPISIFFDGDDGKPWKPCKTATRCLAAIWGKNASQWIGLHCTIYNDPTVTWAGAQVGGIRVSHMEGLDKPRTLKLAKTRGKKGAVTIQPLQIEPQHPKQYIQKAQEEARKAARKGKDAFTAWWKANHDKQDAAKAIMDELKGLAEKADKPTPVPEIDDDEIPM